MKYLMIIMALLLSACSSTSSNIADTMNLIALSEESAPNGVKGQFNFLIKAVGKRRGTVFLNTELDYRDRRALSIVLYPKVVSELTNKYASIPETYFMNKNISVTGEAKREKIYFYSKGKLTSKYYYQTHIDVTSLDQISVLN